MKINATYTGDIVPRSTKVIYCGVSAFRDACYQLVAAFMITYITFAGVLDTGSQDAYLAQILTINILIVVYRIWDGLNDPLMGLIIDKFHFKNGKYKPWILIGGILNTGVVLTLFLARPTGWGFVTLFAIFYFLWDFAWTINDIAYWSMLPSLTSDAKQRNSITTWMQISISIGVFALYAVVPMLVGNSEGEGAARVYQIIAVVVTVLFLISQIVLYLFCPEHARDPKEEKKDQEDVHFKDMFTLFKKNVPFRRSILGILLNYLAAGTVVAFAMYYFYFTYGYADAGGGTAQFIFTIMYAVGTLLAQVSYPLLCKIKWLNRKRMLWMSAIIFSVGYLLLFLLGFPLFGEHPIAWGEKAGGLTWLIYPAGILIFLGQGYTSVIQIVQMQSCIEYNEWKYGERKEAVVSSMRALVAKWGSAIQQGLITATLAITGLYSVSQLISNEENLRNSGLITGTAANEVIGEGIAAIEPSQMIGLGIGMIAIPLVIMLISVFIEANVFNIDEKKYDEIKSELDKRHEADKKALEAEAPKA